MTFTLPGESTLVQVILRVRDLATQLAFWQDVVGLQEEARRGPEVILIPQNRRFHLVLLHDPDAPLRPLPSIGLYHIALLLPHRQALAAAVRRLLETGGTFEGASDHGVSEAVYFRDPEGNGLELYRDKPRDQWPRPPHGRGVAMRTRPLDLEALLALAPQSRGVDPDTRLGHLHLHVPDLDQAEDFFHRTLGLHVTQRDYPGARFFAAGDYHHHIGTNIWARGRLAPEGATGLVAYTWQLPRGTLAPLLAHLRHQARPHRAEPGRVGLQDPSGAWVWLQES